MSFAYPWAFLALIPLALLAWLHRRRRHQHALSYSSTEHLQDAEKSLRQRLLWLPPFLFLASMIAVVVALARPQTDQVQTRDVHEGIAIMMLIDISSSMDMNTGFAGSRETRLEAAKKVLEGFVAGDGDTLKGRPHDLVGIVSFARYADTVCPLTLSHDAVTYITREIEVQGSPQRRRHRLRRCYRPRLRPLKNVRKRFKIRVPAKA